MALPSDPSKLILTDADITRAGPLEAALDGKAPASRFQSGTGSPEGVVAAPPGTEYTDTVGTTGAWKWLKKAGTGATGWEVTEGSTGWIALWTWNGGSVTFGGPLPAGLAPNGTVGGGIYIRRDQNVVSFSIVEAKVTANDPEILNLGRAWLGPGGSPYPAVPMYYRLADGTEHVGNVDVGTSLLRIRVPSGAILASKGSGGYGVQGSWPTDPARWPTSVPSTS